MTEKGTVNIGIIGTGFARTTHIPGFLNCLGARVSVIASGHKENAEKVAREFNIPHVAEDWHALITRADVDLVSIVTPPVTHKEIAIAALQAGKAVLCEKPMAMSAEETNEMKSQARESGLLALVDHQLRFLPSRRKMREIMRNGEIGSINNVKLFFRSDSRLDPQRDWDWWSDRESGGGSLGAIGSHVVDSLHWLLDAEISEVSATLSTHVKERVNPATGQPRKVTSDDEASLLLRVKDDSLTYDTSGLVSMSMVEAGKPEHRLEVFGWDGALLEESGKLFRAAVGEKKWEPIETERGELGVGMHDNEWSRGFTMLAQKIVEAIRQGRTTVEGAATFEDGHRTQLVLDAARRSSEQGTRIIIS